MERFASPRSGRQLNRWIAIRMSPSIHYWKRAVCRPLRGLGISLWLSYLGLTPQALCWRLLRRLKGITPRMLIFPR
jgi:hypothetical protein